MFNIEKLCSDIDRLSLHVQAMCDDNNIYVDGPFGQMFGVDDTDLLDLVRIAKIAGEQGYLRKVFFGKSEKRCRLAIYLRTSQRVGFSVSGLI